MKKRKIALVYDAIYPYVKGGAERRCYELGKRLSNENNEVHLYGMKLWSGEDVIEQDHMTLHGIMPAYPLYTKQGRRSIRQALLFGLASFKLAFEDFDVMDCSGFPYFSLLPARIITWFRRKPLYSTWHEVWGLKYWREYLGGALGSVGYAVEWLTARLPDYIIANSELTAERLQSELHVNRKITVVPAGVDTPKIAGVKPAEATSDIIYTGRLMDFKNVDLIIRALAHLGHLGTKPVCTIIGDGPDKPKLQALAESLGVAGQLRWLGFLHDSDDVYSHMKSSKVFVLPSKREGFGMVLLEANACGLPVLTASYPTNAAKDLIQPGENGYVFDPQAVPLATAIQKTLDESGHLKYSSLSVASHYDWEYLSGKQSEAYEL